MSTARFHPRLSLCLLFTALLISASLSQEQATISIMIDPPEATVHIGETTVCLGCRGGREDEPTQSRATPINYLLWEVPHEHSPISSAFIALLAVYRVAH